VVIVFVGHGATAPGLWPGHVGVTVFFFLSGYLITTLLRRERERFGRIALSRFYLRRLLRITPPALIAVALCSLAGAAGLLPATTTGWGVLAEVFNYTNYYLVVAGREGLPPESSMLWSLAVEEHFYLLFPAALILLLWMKFSYRRIAVSLILCAAAVLVWRIVLFFVLDASFFRLYVSTDTRFDGLILGAALALAWNPALGDRPPFGFSTHTLSRVLAPAGVVVFAVSATLPDALRLTVADSIQYACLVPIFWFIITRPDSRICRVLNHPVAVRLGALSFSVYLLHRLVLGLVAEVVPVAPLIDVLSLALTLALAEIVFRTVESPAARLRKRLESGGRGTPQRKRASTA
jgi:peptidoglycan/LPS O-acetylase OafA/YrhL